jgi:hypothetical protein
LTNVTANLTAGVGPVASLYGDPVATFYNGDTAEAIGNYP